MIIQVGWSQIIQDEILALPKLGCVGFHSSLLPKDRGGSPINWAIIRGETVWGVTLYYLDPGIDNGDIIAQKKFAIGLNDTCKSVYQKAGKAMVQMLQENIPLLLEGKAPRTPQAESEATYNRRRKPEEGLIDWNKSAKELYDWIRAQTHPYPGAFTFLNSTKCYIWQSKLDRRRSQKKLFTSRDKVGTFIVTKEKKEVWVKTGKDFLRIDKIQFENESEVKAFDFFKTGMSQGHFRSNKL